LQFDFIFQIRVSEPLYHKGYNPAQSIESSVPIPKIKATNRYCTSKTTNDQILKTQSTSHINTCYEMRDLYHRKEKLAYWINRAYTELHEPDKTDVLNFIQFMHDREVYYG
jgi:beta-xylosidase